MTWELGAWAGTPPEHTLRRARYLSSNTWRVQMPKMSFEMAPPETPPPSRFGRILRIVLFIAAIIVFGLITVRLTAPELLDHPFGSTTQ
jgi:hypothetical protein